MNQVIKISVLAFLVIALTSTLSLARGGSSGGSMGGSGGGSSMGTNSRSWGGGSSNPGMNSPETSRIQRQDMDQDWERYRDPDAEKDTAKAKAKRKEYGTGAMEGDQRQQREENRVREMSREQTRQE